VTWSILYGARQAYRVSSKISQWLKPERYFVFFPYSVCSADELKTIIKAKPASKEIFFSHGGKTALDGINLPFIFMSAFILNLFKYLKLSTFNNVVLP
jgi:hypothetical protein